MGPKNQRKSPNRSKSPKKGDNSDAALTAANLSDENWQSLVAFIVPSNSNDQLYLEQLEKSCKLGNRRRFMWISRKDLIDQVITVTQNMPTKPKKSVDFTAKKSVDFDLTRTMAQSRVSRTSRQSIIDKRSIVTASTIAGKPSHQQRIGKKSTFRPMKMSIIDDTAEETATSYSKNEKRKEVIYESEADETIEQTGPLKAVSKKTANTQSVLDYLSPQTLNYMELIKPFIDVKENREDVPDNLMLKLLKSKMMNVRAAELEKREKRNVRNEKKPTKEKKEKSPTSKQPQRSKKGATGPLPDIDKQSQLKKRDEIEEMEKFIDDEPSDGPDFYFIISGFHSLNMLSAAEESNLPIDCVIKFRASQYDRVKDFLKEIDEREKQDVPHKMTLRINSGEADKDRRFSQLMALAEEKQAQLLKVNTTLETFWRDVNPILENSSDKSMLQNIARLKYIVKNDPEIKSWFELDARADFARKLFDEVSERLFALVVQKRQYKNYINHLKIFPVPACLPIYAVNVVEPQPDQADAERQSIFDVRYYNELMDSIPPEYISSSLVLTCIVEQIVATEEKRPLPSEVKNVSIFPKIQNLNSEISKHFTELINDLALSRNERDDLAQYLPEIQREIRHQQQNGSILINHSDEINRRLKGIYDADKVSLDPIKAEHTMLGKSAMTTFTGLPNIPQHLSRERASRLQELLHFCVTPEVTNADVDRAIKLFIFECMNLAYTDSFDEIVSTNEYTVVPWDDPYPNINSTLSQDKQVHLKNLTVLGSRTFSPQAQSKRPDGRDSSNGTGSIKSIKFNDVLQMSNHFENTKDSWGPSSILKSRPSSTKLSVQSVRFDDEELLEHFELPPTKTIEQVLELIRKSQQRNLAEWNFAEHFEPKVLVQNLQEAIYTHPFINSYYCKRDHSVMLSLSNPFNEKTLCNNQFSCIKLHSNVGFRNYLERIYDMIVDWTRDEEASYQAQLTSKEVSSFAVAGVDENRSRSSKSTKETEKKEPSQTNSKEKDKSDKDDKKSTTESKKKKDGPEQIIEIEETLYITEEFVGTDSLKAWKKTQDKHQVQQIIEKEHARGGRGKSPSNTNNNTNTVANPKVGKKDSKSKSPVPNAGRNQSESPRPATQAQLVREREPPVKKQTITESKSTVPKTIVEEVKSSDDSKSVATKKIEPVFNGYDVGNSMIYLKTNCNYMFPYDGSLVKTEKIELKTGSRLFITTSVIKDGNVFSVHIVDPKVEPPKILKLSEEDDLVKQTQRSTTATSGTAMNTERKLSAQSSRISNADQTKVQKQDKSKHEDLNESRSDVTMQSATKSESDGNDSKFAAKHGCFTATFRDGFNLSYSIYETKSAKIDSANIRLISARLQEQQTQQQPNDDKQSRKSYKSKYKKEATPEPTEIIKESPKCKVLPWCQLYLSTPNGLSCTFIPETYSGVPAAFDYEPHKLLVKQYYSAKCNQSSAESYQHTNLNIYKEKSRIIKSDGTVIKFMTDESIEILCQNGAIYRRESDIVKTDHSAEMESLDSESITREKIRTATRRKDQSVRIDDSVTPKADRNRSKWTYISPNGNRYAIRNDKQYDLIGYNRNVTAKCPQSDEILITREDNVKFVKRPDNSMVVNYADGTRITTFFVRDLVNESETSLLSDQQNEKLTKYLKVECTGFATTIFNCETSQCTLLFGNDTYVICDPIKMVYNVCYHNGDNLDIDFRGVSTYTPRQNTDRNRVSNKFLFYHNADTIFDHVDYAGNVFKVDKFGNSTTIPVESTQNTLRSDSTIAEYNYHAPKFYIIHKDSSGTEFLRFRDIEEYMKDVETDPMAAITRDEVQGYPNIIGTTVLRPIKDSTEWTCDYDEFDITPVGLRCRNLNTFPTNPNVKVSGGQFATKLGKGLDIDTKNRRVKNLPLEIPKRIEVRQFIEYDRLNEEIRMKLMEGLRNYIVYVAERAEKHRLLLAFDPRSEVEKLTAFKILQLARPDELNDADIAALYRQSVGYYKDIDSTQIKHIKSIWPKLKSDPQEKLMAELDKERVNRETWRKSFVPPYFESVWGKHFLDTGLEAELNKVKRRNSSEQVQQNNTQNEFNVQESFDEFKDYDDEQKPPSRKYPLPPILSAHEGMPERDDFSLRQKLIEAYQKKDVDRIDSHKIPNAIKGSRPNAQPNLPFWFTEEPIRRKVKNSIIKASIMNGKSLHLRRGCEIYPNKVNFGVLREGLTYATDLELINVGVDICRFKVKPFPAESGYRVLYKPGPLAPGISASISILYHPTMKQCEDEQSNTTVSSSVEERTDLEITTETDVLSVPIYAKVTTVDEFNKLFNGNIEAGKHPRVRIVGVNQLQRQKSTAELFPNVLTGVKSF